MFRSPSSSTSTHTIPRLSLFFIQNRLTLIIPLTLFYVISLVLLIAIIVINSGHFMYTLDDPYIHLALAENIAHGHYGVNLGEMSAPSSSILWPILFVPVMGLPFAEIIPLIVNIAASTGVLLIAHTILCRVFTAINPVQKNTLIIIILIMWMLLVNVIGLIFTGMEHSLQLFLAMTILLGLLYEQEHNTMPWWFGCALILGPLIRYENLCLTVPALLHLLQRRHYYGAFICATVLGLTIGGFSLFLYSAGLGVLPTSVLAKSAVTSDTQGLQGLAGNLQMNLLNRQGALLLIGVLLLLFNQRSEQRPLALWAIMAAMLHILVGKFGWYARYEIYIWAVMLMTLVYVYSESFANHIFLKSKLYTTLIAILFLFVVGMPYLYALINTPLASNNIYQQQYQMHRFAVDYYKKPVAVNDLGWVTYRNNAYVLDFGGLASREALLQRQSKNIDWMSRLAQTHNVRVAMIYDSWFQNVPATWIPLGRLSLSGPAISVADSVVTFYALDTSTTQEIQPLLRDFQQSLPPRVDFVLAADHP